jgi:hypothetical protein
MKQAEGSKQEVTSKGQQAEGRKKKAQVKQGEKSQHD